MTGRLLSLIYDPQTFEIAPNYGQWQIAESDEHLLLTVTMEKGQRENFEVRLQGFCEANVKGLPEGDYNLHATVLSGVDKYKIRFAFFTAHNGVEQDHIIFDERMFFESFAEACAESAMSPGFNRRQFEREFGMSYLMDQFGHRIEGSPQFWQTFEEDFDTVTTPINHAIMRDNGNLPKKPYYISLNGAKPVIRPY